MRDIFVDNNVAKNFCNPLDPEYKEFIEWLFERGSLVLSQKLMSEYCSSTGSSYSPTNIVVIIAKLQAEGRLVQFSSGTLKAFRIPKRIEKRLVSNWKDRDHLKAVLLSNRKLALSGDANFRQDINNYPGYRANAARRPNQLPYQE